MIKNPQGLAFFLIVTAAIAYSFVFTSTRTQVGKAMQATRKKYFTRDNYRFNVSDLEVHYVQTILFTAAGLILLHTKNVPGAIEGSAQEEQWYAKSFLRNIPVENPLRRLDSVIPLAKKRSLDLRDDIPVYSWVVFNNRSTLPANARSEGYIRAEELTEIVNNYPPVLSDDEIKELFYVFIRGRYELIE